MNLGPRASLLLGMLGGPQTADEILRAIDMALTNDDLMNELNDMPTEWGTPAVTLRSISNGGTVEIERLLERMKLLGFTDYLADPITGARLWRRNECLAA